MPLDLARQRLRNQHITEPIFTKPEEEVAWLAAAQAQDFAGAKWALGSRLLGATESDLDRAFAAGTMLRTHVLRPTWHFVTPADIGWLLALTAPHVHATSAYMYRQQGLDSATFKRSNAVLAKALKGGQQLTRDELRVVLEKAGVATDNGVRLSYLMMGAELEGLICSGARRGKQFTYALLEERAPQAKTLERPAALAALAERYFKSRGPATVQDFAKWSGLAVAHARQGLEAVAAQFEQETIDGHTYWFAPLKPLAKTKAPIAHLLSIYDEYISSYKDRSAMVSEAHGAKLQSQGNALSYLVLINGQIVGTWKRTLKKHEVVITLDIFVRLTEAEQHAIALAAQQYGKFLGLEAVLNN